MTSRLASSTLRIGDAAPPISLVGHEGERIELAEALDASGVLLLFSPGAWSPSTRRQVGEINAIYDRFREASVAVVVLITQDARSLRDRLGAYAIPFPILADERRQVARDYGVYRAVSLHGIGVTRPSAFVIDRRGIIRFIYVGEGETDVPDTESLFQLAVGLVGVQPVPSAETVEAEPPAEAIFDELVEMEEATEIDEMTTTALSTLPATDDHQGQNGLSGPSDEVEEDEAHLRDSPSNGELAEAALPTDEPSPTDGDAPPVPADKTALAPVASAEKAEP